MRGEGPVYELDGGRFGRRIVHHDGRMEHVPCADPGAEKVSGFVGTSAGMFDSRWMRDACRRVYNDAKRGKKR